MLKLFLNEVLLYYFALPHYSICLLILTYNGDTKI